MATAPKKTAEPGPEVVDVPAPDEVVNLMMQCSMDVLVRSLDELDAALKTWLAKR